MKWMKQAAKQLLTAALALCLLLSCAVSASAASLQTPAWMRVWSNTRTSAVIAQLEKDQFSAEMQVDGVNSLVKMVRSNGKMYLQACTTDGTPVQTILVRDGSAYELDASRKLAIRLGDESAAYSAIGLNEQALEKSISTGKATGYTATKKTLHGKTYDAEVFQMTLDGKPVEMTYCYEGDTLRYLITKVSSKQAALEYKNVTDKVDESLLQIPAGYTICTRGADGKFYNASGKVVG